MLGRRVGIKTLAPYDYLLVLALLVFSLFLRRNGTSLGVDVQGHLFAGPVGGLCVKVIALAADPSLLRLSYAAAAT